MGGDGFTADPERLAARAAEFDDLVDRARRIVDGLTRSLDEGPEPWGRDAVGRAFAAAHVDPATRTRETLEELPAALGGLGTAFAEAAEAYRAADRAASETVSGAADTGSAGTGPAGTGSTG
ncbi:PE domain-containing protein [Saccharomonospora iraqiensis]|uniref:PE domain-containing protein n=1 Tax=Saccharomonospora iraqiensis TaxID=52698 RepID=UPI00022E0089|nr:PE domain-containing protein [Saccharomonospora iraqiensis]